MVKKSSIKRTFSSILSLLLAVVMVSGAGAASLTQDQPPETPTSQIEVVSPYYSYQNITTENGSEITAHIINGPSHPLPEYEAERTASITTVEPQGTLANFPSYSWVFGCSAVSGAMIAAWYDRGSYPNLYTGPTNNGLYPLTDTGWPTWKDSVGVTYPNNPLVASHSGLDGRTIKGSIDDYWVEYDSEAPDPYITGGWTQHAWGTAIGDYMKTSQSAYGKRDGATTFYTWTSLPTKLTCTDMENNGWADLDGTYGRKLFYEARGYTVTDCYNQKTENNGGGFTMANFRAEIDAGRPVLLNLKGHSIVGYGYSGNTIYIRDTWDNTGKVYTMPWGGSYQDMELLSVSVVNLAPGTAVPSKQFLPMVIKAPPPPTNPFKNPGFEQGRVSWNESSTNGWELIVRESDIPDGNIKAHGGAWLSWLGGGNDVTSMETSMISQTVTISAAAQYLHFWYWSVSNDICNYDYFYVGVNGNYFYNETICQSKNTGGWVKKVINLSSFVGTGKTVQFKLVTDESLVSNVFIDDVSMSASSVTSQQSPVSTELFPGAALERK